MKAIPLRRFGYLEEFAWVDDEDYANPEIGGKTWRQVAGGYIYRTGPRPHRHGIYLAREILGLPRGGGHAIEADHINRNNLDNRRCNLRVVNRSENVQNTKVRSDSRSGLRGVGLHPTTGRWRARIKINGKRFELGTYFPTKEAAYEAYCKAAKIMHRFNPVTRDETPTTIARNRTYLS